MDDLPAGTCPGWFGIHPLAPGFNEIFEEMIRDNGEFQLTRAQKIQRQLHGSLSLAMAGAERFDCGVPDDFVRSERAFRCSP